MAKKLVNCDNCGKEFAREIKAINRSAILGYKTYCSGQCSIEARRDKDEYRCTECEKIIYRPKSWLQRNVEPFCSHSCRSINLNKRRISGRKASELEPRNYRSFAFRLYGIRCAVCGYRDIRVLEVHHIDSNRSNNLAENLMVLCPTHHDEIQAGVRELPPRDRIVDDNDDYCYLCLQLITNKAS